MQPSQHRAALKYGQIFPWRPAYFVAQFALNRNHTPSMLSIPKSKSEFFFSAAGATLLLSLSLGTFAWFELCEFREAVAEHRAPIRVSGTLQFKAKQLLITKNGDTLLSCASAFCSYPGAFNDKGRVVTVGMTGGRIVEVMVDGQLRDFREDVILTKQATISRALLGLVFFVSLSFLGFQTRPKARNN